jgi:hypothetical protein
VKTKFALILALAALTAGNLSATIFRYLNGDNTAILSDWNATEDTNEFFVVTDGAPTRPFLSTLHYLGSNSVGFQVPTDTSGNKERVEYKILEATDTNGLAFTNARYCGFAFMLASSPLPFTDSSIFWQAWQGSPWGAPASLKFGSGSSAPYLIRLNVRNASVGPDSSVPDIQLWSNKVINPGTWYSFVIYIEPRYNTNGNIKLWINGTNYLDWTGEIGYDPAQVTNTYDGLDIKDGVYQPDANNGHTFYFDQVRVADTYAEACPIMPPRLTNAALTRNAWTMLVNGDAGANYTIQSSTNLADWTSLGATNPPAGPFRFTDNSAPAARRFYRVTAAP